VRFFLGDDLVHVLPAQRRRDAFLEAGVERDRLRLEPQPPQDKDFERVLLSAASSA
jgi:predicted O-linked N-acetylglucosamine transferase (SPINDLY family)